MDQDYEHRNRIAELIVWLLIFVVLNIIYVAVARAEPGDKYETSIRVAVPPHAKPAGHRTAPAVVASGRPIQCPHRYCGCDLAIEVFGKADPSLFAAAAWFRFPRAAPAPGMVAVRKHHVMRLIEPVGNHWRVRDPNSGGGLTREHVRSLSGFTIVNPNRAGI